MSNKYVSPSNLERYDGKIKEYIDDKVDSIDSGYDDSLVLKKQGRQSTTADGVDGATGFSLNISSSDGINSYIRLQDESNVSNETALYPAEMYTPKVTTDVIKPKTSGGRITVNGSMDVNDFSAVSASIGTFDVDATFNSSVATPVLNVSEIYDGAGTTTGDIDIFAARTIAQEIQGTKITASDKFVGNLEGTASKNLPLAGGTMTKNANITIPSSNLVGGITLNDDTGYIATLTPDCLHIQDSEGNTSVIGGSSVYSPEFVGNLTGTASKATTLANTTAIGSATQPVYINASGVPTKCTYTLGKSVPSNAVFTDTKYTLPTASSSTLGGVKTTSNVTNTSGYTACPIINGVPYYKPSSVTTTEGADPTIYQSKKIQCGSGATASNTGIAMGDGTSVNGDFAMALGYETETLSACALSIGIYNDDTSSGTGISTYSWLVDGQGAKNAFMIGRGSSETTRANAFRVTYSGATYALSAFNSSGADYAEFISEWADGNINNEDRVGYFVTLKDNKLYKANDGDYILGVTSGNPSVVGNGDETYFWKYERDEFNRFVYIDSPILDENGNEFIGEDGNIAIGKTMKLSDKYDSTQTYIARKDRPEWDYVGMIGVIPVRDDGTCITNGYCKCGVNGIATIATEKDTFTYFVKERISDNVIAVIVR